MKLGVILVVILLLLAGCCDPNKPVVTIKFHTSDVYLCGYDEDCDKDIDYWQHYYPDGSKMGKPIYIKEK